MSQAPLQPELLLGHMAHVRRLARRLVFDADLAREVEQETWLAALEHAPRDLRNPRAWLSRVTRHAARRLWSRRERRQDVERLASEDGSEKAPPDLLEREQALRTLLAAVDRLPEPARTAVVLHHLDGLALREVAQRTNAPLETVRSRTKRGLALLREDLGRDQRGGASWCLALVQAMAIAPPHPERGLLLAAREVLLSLTLMSTTLKLAAVTGGVALTLLSGWVWLDRSDPVEPRVPNQPASATPQRVQGGADAGDMQAIDPVPQSSERVAAVSAPVSAPALAPSPVSTTGSLEVELSWAEDGTLAAGVPLMVEPRGGAAGFESFWVESSASGRVTIDDLLPGNYFLHPLFGGLGMVSVKAGATTEVRIAIPPGVRVTGLVRETDGTPVAGAAIFLWPGGYHAQFEGAIVAHSDVRGEFALRSVPAGTGASLSARADRRAPTLQVVLTGAHEGKIRTELVFEAAGRPLAGRVLAPNGQPIAGATLVVGSEREIRILKRADGTMAYPPIGQRIQTDPDGEFQVRGAPLETIPIQVRAPGFAPWRGNWVAEDVDWREIWLEPGARISGVVRDAAGKPVAGAWVRTGPPIFFASTMAVSAADGSYSLEAIAPGTCKLIAESASDGEAKARFQLASGEEFLWDPVLGGGREVRGWVEAPGSARGGWVVRGYRHAALGGSYAQRVTTDADGRFTLRQVPDGEISVSLLAQGSSFPVAYAYGVTAGGPDVVLRPDPDRLPSARITGRLVDQAGTPVRSADVWARHAILGNKLIHPDRTDGTFALGPLPPGEWTVEVDPLTAGWAIARHACVLAAEEELDVGALSLGPGGTLEVTLLGAPKEETAIQAEIHDAEERVVDRLTFADGVASSRPLVPGEYRLTFASSSEDANSADQPFVIVAAEETFLKVRLER